MIINKSSSHQFRNLIPLLSPRYRIIAPDLPGFGFTVIPASRNYTYNFANLATTLGSFLDVLKISKFAVYVFDYGAPVSLRLALERPEAVTALITQNGNAYLDGFSVEFWAPLRELWEGNAPDVRELIRSQALSPDGVKSQYVNGSPNPQNIEPEAYTLDTALLKRQGNKDIQLDLFYDYRKNVELYPMFQQWLRDSGVPVLAVWGKNDVIFIPPGAEAFKRDVKDFEIQFIDAGHFAIENNEEELAGILLGKRGI